MPRTTRLLAAALLLCLALPRPASAQERYREVVHIGAVDSIWSETLQEYRPYIVYTPPSYGDTTVTPQRYPVLYLLDGDAHFHSVSGLVQSLGTGVNGTYAIPELMVVAIPNTDRTRDLTPTRSTTGPQGDSTPAFAEAFAESGGNPDFFRFLGEELVPRVDAAFRTMPYRVLVGHSFGGITVINALYELPELFDAWVAIDPSLWWDEETLLRRAREYFESARLDGEALYVAQANTIDPDGTEPNTHFSAISRFDAVVKAYDRSGLRYDFRYYDRDDHGSVPLVATYDALRFVFEGYRVPLLRVVAEPPLLTTHFDRVSERLGTTFRPSEGLIRQLTGFAAQVDTAQLLPLGEIWVETYPESHRGYAFLGDSWKERGDPERARRYYEQALERSPGDEALREKLEEVGG